MNGMKNKQTKESIALSFYGNGVRVHGMFPRRYVIAPDNGYLRQIESNSIYGGCVELGNSKYKYIFKHIICNVKNGMVIKGEIIGIVGKNPKTKKPLLYFEVQENEIPLSYNELIKFEIL